MDRDELMRMQPEDAIKVLAWDNIEWLFEPKTAFELMLRLNHDGTLGVLRKHLKSLVKHGRQYEDALIKEAKPFLIAEDYYRHLLDEKSKQEKRMSNKIRITMKDPDGVYDSMDDAGYDLDDLPSVVDGIVKKYFEFKEVVTIELDLETGEATLVPR